MHCSIIDTIKKEIIKRATSYRELEDEVVITITPYRDAETAYAIASGKVKKINADYEADKFGDVVFLNSSYKDGVGIKIIPSAKLKSAMAVKAGVKSFEEFQRDLAYYNGDEALRNQEEGFQDQIDESETTHIDESILQSRRNKDFIPTKQNIEEQTTEKIKTIEDELKVFLNNFGFEVKQLDNLKDVSGYNIIGATDFLEKTIFVDKNNLENAYTKEAAYAIFNLLGRKNILRKDLIASIHLLKDYDTLASKYKTGNLPDYQIRQLVAIDYLQEKLKEAHEETLETSNKAFSRDATAKNKLEYTILKIKQWWSNIIRKFFKSYKRGYIEDVFNQIANDVINNNTRLFNTTENISYKKMELTGGFKDLNRNLTKFGAINSGSYSLNRQGTLTRASVHDLDYFIPYEIKDKFIENVIKAYPDAIFSKPYSGVMGTRSVTLSFKVHGKNVDLFLPTTQEESNNNKIIEINKVKYHYWKNIFDAKIRIGSQKHLRDLAGFVPFQKPNLYYNINFGGYKGRKSDYLNIIGQRHYNFDFIQSKFNENTYSSEEKVKATGEVKSISNKNLENVATDFFKTNNIDYKNSDLYNILRKTLKPKEALIAYYKTYSENFLKFYGNTRERTFSPFSFGKVDGNYSKPSILKDYSGEPLIFYHGTGTIFSKFDKKYFLSGEGMMAFGAGFYTSNFKPTADEYRDASQAAMKTFNKLLEEKNKDLLDLLNKLNISIDSKILVGLMTNSVDVEDTKAKTSLLNMLGLTETKALYTSLTNPIFWEKNISESNKEKIEEHFKIKLKNTNSGKIYRELENKLEISDKEVSARLYQIGIDGVIHNNFEGETHVIFFEPVQAKSVTNSGLFSLDNENMYDPIEINKKDNTDEYKSKKSEEKTTPQHSENRDEDILQSRRNKSFNKINYKLKAVEILSSKRAEQVFAKGKKNNWNLNKILTELQIPKEQKQVILDNYNGGNTTNEELALDLASKYSFAVEIKTARESVPDYDMVDVTGEGDFELTEFIPDTEQKEITDDDGNIIRIEEVLSEKGKQQIKDRENTEPTQHYSNLTVPGGINYTENRIITPQIVPSIKGHPEFAEDNDIGWFRSDEQESKSTETRRILEIQSDLFQKGRRDKNLLDNEYELLSEKDYIDDVYVKRGEKYYFINKYAYLDGEEERIEITKKEYDNRYEVLDKLKDPQNQFLQLLNKRSNWVTFFVKSIIQDSAKKGYERVLFPRGKTAAKVEGHETLADEIELHTDRINKIKDAISNPEKYKISDGYSIPIDKGDITGALKSSTIDKFIPFIKKTLKVEEETVKTLKTQGIEKLKPIENFYENTITNVLKKGGFKSEEITDEHGNKWNEVKIAPQYSENPVLLSRRNKVHKYKGITEKPLGDNYQEIISFLEDSLEKKEYKLTQLKNDLRTNKARRSLEDFKKTGKESRIEKIYQHKLKLISKLKNEIDDLSHNISVLKADKSKIFHAIDLDLNNIEAALKSTEEVDMAEIRKKLDFYRSLNRSFEGKYAEETAKLGEKIDALSGEKYERLLIKKSKELLKNKENIQRVLNNINDLKDSNDPLERERFAKINRKMARDRGEIRDDNQEITLDDLLVGEKGASGILRYLGGMAQTDSFDTIIPQYLLYEFVGEVNTAENRVINITDRQEALNLKLKREKSEIDEDKLLLKDKDGKETGYIVDVFSSKWYEKESEMKALREDYLKGSSTEEKSYKYGLLWDWLKKNTVAINFFKIPIVKEIYGEMEEYKQYFTYSDEEMQKYEKDLISVLGPRYKDKVIDILNSLESFEQFKIQDTENKYHEIEVERRNMWKFLYKYLNNDKSAMTETPGGYPIHFGIGFRDMKFIPRQVSREGKINTGYYQEEFQEVLKNENLLEQWEIYREYSDYINAAYHTGSQRIKYPKLDVPLMEKTVENLNSLKDMNVGKFFKKLPSSVLNLLHEYKALFYEKGYNTEGSEGVIPNKIDRSSYDFLEREKAYRLQGYSSEDAKKLATQEILPTYSKDIKKSFKAGAIAAALNNARESFYPKAQMLQNYFEVINEESKGKFEGSLDKINMFLSKIIMNQSIAERGSGRVFGKEILKGDSRIAKFIDNLGKKLPWLHLSKASTRLLSVQEKINYKAFEKLKKEGFNATEAFTDNIDGEKFYFDRRTVGKEDKYYIDDRKNALPVNKAEFDKRFQRYLDKKLDSFGLTLTTAGVVEGLIRMQILKFMGLSPESGINNRIEGKNTNFIMDATGEYWTSGNIDYAEKLMAWANLDSITQRAVGNKLFKDRSKTLNLFEQFLERLGGIQDRKDLIHKSANKTEFLNAKVIDLYSLAVTFPEEKNQGAVAAAVMMSEIIKDNDGNEYPLLDKHTLRFTAFDLNEEGNLVVKPEFSNSFDFESKQMSNLTSKISNAVSRSQGNYFNFDIITIMNNLFGKAALSFKKWFGSHYEQRFGMLEADEGSINIDYASGKLKNPGRAVLAARASKTSVLTYLGAMTGISMGTLLNSFSMLTGGAGLLGSGFAIVTGVGAIGGGAIGIVAVYNFLKKYSNQKTITNSVDSVKNAISFLESTMIETLNYPSRLFSAIPGTEHLRVKNKAFTGERVKPLTKEEIGALKAMSREIAVMLTWLLIKLGVGFLTYGSGDDDDSEDRKLFNYFQNTSSRAINNLNIFSQPQQEWNDLSRIGIIADLGEMRKAINYTFFDPDVKKAKKSVFKLLPVPKIVRSGLQGMLPFESNYLNDNFTNQYQSLHNLIKNSKTNGEYLSKKFYQDRRKELKSKAKDDFISMKGVDGNKNILSAITSNIVKGEYGNGKPTGVSYKEYLENFDKLVKIPSTEVLREKLKQKLEKAGLSNSEINAIISKRFKNYK